MHRISLLSQHIYLIRPHIFTEGTTSSYNDSTVSLKELPNHISHYYSPVTAKITPLTLTEIPSLSQMFFVKTQIGFMHAH
jgi:hypothetical protein